MSAGGGPALLGARLPIASYGGGGFGFAGGLRHAGSILFLDDGVYAWDATNFASLTVAHFDPVFARLETAATRPAFFLLGVGAEPVFLTAEIRRLFAARRLGVDSMNTAAACRTCNVLLAEGRSFAAGLIAI